MAWTNPLTWVSQALTAALLNQQLRDNMNETAPGKATAAGRFFVTTAANSIAERLPTTDFETAGETTASTSYTNLATAGPAVTVTTGTAALVIVSAVIANNTSGIRSFMGYAVSSATTIAATDVAALTFDDFGPNSLSHLSFTILETGLTAGSNVFTAKYRAEANTASFDNRRISVIPF